MMEPNVWVVDGSKASVGASAEEKAAQVKAGQESLLSIATTFLRKLQKAVSSTPLELRCMAYFIWINARTFCPERSAVLLGGFIFLRIVNPALVSPESHKLVPPGEKVGPSFKPNCIALCRLLQMLSNNKRYPAEDGALLNEWLDKNHEAMDSYLLDLASDPNYVEGSRPFGAQSRLPEERHRRLRDVLDAEEWEALHVALVRSKTHVLLRSTIAPVFATAGASAGSSGVRSPRGSAPASSTASPVRSRSGSRFRGEEEEVAIYNDGKMRARPVRRGSLSGGALFASLSQPSLPLAVSPPSSSSPLGAPTASSSMPGSSGGTPLGRTASGGWVGAGTPSSSAGTPLGGSTPGPSTPTLAAVHGHSFRPSSPSSPSLTRADTAEGLLQRVTMGSRGRSRTGSNAGSALHVSASDVRVAVNGAGDEESPDRAFFALVESLPLPHVIKLERFEHLVEPLKRTNLVAEGLLSDTRRASLRIGPSQTELLVRLGYVLLDRDFGIRG